MSECLRRHAWKTARACTGVRKDARNERHRVSPEDCQAVKSGRKAGTGAFCQIMTKESLNFASPPLFPRPLPLHRQGYGANRAQIPYEMPVARDNRVCDSREPGICPPRIITLGRHLHPLRGHRGMLCAPRTLSAKARATNLGHGLGSRTVRVAATGGVGVHVAGGGVGIIAVGGTRHFLVSFCFSSDQLPNEISCISRSYLPVHF